MSRYIDADKARDNSTDPYVRIYLDSQPTADVAPVVHAHWERVTGIWDGYASCSACKQWTKSGFEYDNCPNCFAKMDEEEEK